MLTRANKPVTNPNPDPERSWEQTVGLEQIGGKTGQTGEQTEQEGISETEGVGVQTTANKAQTTT